MVKVREKRRRNHIMRKTGLTKRSLTIILAVMTAISLTACSSQGGSSPVEPGQTETTEHVDTGFVVAGPGDYDSADTPILIDKNVDDNTVTFLNLDLGRLYTLSMDGTTRLYNRHGESISLEQLSAGDVVDITFYKGTRHLTTMKLSEQAWSRESVGQYNINIARSEVTIGSDVYKLSKNTQYLSEGSFIEQMDLNEADILSFQGIGSTVLSITVEKGHGYLRLANDEHFVGGWIEIGQSLIRRITEDMLLTVPEGSYQVNFSHNGSSGVKRVVINRNEETTLDIGDLEVAEPQTGMVLFSLSPADLELYIDGELVDTSLPVTLEYGIHQMIARADGYQSITQYLRVGQESAGIDITLDPVRGGTDGSSSDSSSETSTTVDTTTSYYRVYVDAPENVEVYVDGSYVGISPCNFRKVSGTHIITLRRIGYETRSYTIQVDSEDKDITFSFADLAVSGGGTTDTTESLTGSANSGSANSGSSTESEAEDEEAEDEEE